MAVRLRNKNCLPNKMILFLFLHLEEQTFRKNHAHTVDERKEAAIGVVVIDKKPLLFGLEIISKRNYILVYELAHHLHIPTSEK